MELKISKLSKRMLNIKLILAALVLHISILKNVLSSSKKLIKGSTEVDENWKCFDKAFKMFKGLF